MLLLELLFEYEVECKQTGSQNLTLSMRMRDADTLSAC